MCEVELYAMGYLVLVATELMRLRDFGGSLGRLFGVEHFLVHTNGV